MPKNPYDPANLARVKNTEDITSLGPHMRRSIVIAPDGKAYVGKHAEHERIIWEAMRVGGYAGDYRGDLELDAYRAYPEKSGCLYVSLVNDHITGHGARATASQIRTLKDICLYVHISDPGKIMLITHDLVDPLELCRGVAA